MKTIRVEFLWRTTEEFEVPDDFDGEVTSEMIDSAYATTAELTDWGVVA